MDKCDTCIFRYNCESSQEYYCKHNNYLEYDGPENLTNYDRFMKCTPEQLTSAFYNLKKASVYTEGRLLDIENNPNDFLKWLKAKSNLLDPEIFEMRIKKVSKEVRKLSEEADKFYLGKSENEFTIIK